MSGIERPRPAEELAREAGGPIEGNLSRVSGARLAQAVGLWLVLSFLAGAATIGLSRTAGLDTTANDLAAAISAEAYVFLVGSLLVAFGGIRQGARALGIRSIRPRTAVAGVASVAFVWVAVAIGYALAGVLGALVDALVWIGRDGDRLGSLGPGLTVVSLVRATVIAPLAEEMLFRGAIFGWLRSRLSTRATIVITAGLFAVIHGLPVFLPLAFGLGLGLGWVRERSHSIVPGLAFHVLHNSALFLLVYLFAGW